MATLKIDSARAGIWVIRMTIKLQITQHAQASKPATKKKYKEKKHF